MAQILIVDDDTAVRTFVIRALQQRGYTAHEARDGDSALAFLDSASAIDLVVSDIVMPGMDGVELREELKQRYPCLKVLLMTGYAGGKDQARAIASEATEVIEKPFTLQTIYDAVARALEKD